MEAKELRKGIGFLAGIQFIGVSLSFLFAGIFLNMGMSWRTVFLLCAGDTGITNGMLMIWSSIGSTFGTAVKTALRADEFVPGPPISVEAGWSNTFLASARVAGIGLLAALLIPRGVGKGMVARPTAGR